MKRLISIALVALATTTACGGRAPVFEEGTNTQQRGVTLPDPVPATPVFVGRTKQPLTDEQLERLRKTKGVAIVAPIAIKKVPVEGELGKVWLRVGAVQPLEFRSVAPPATRDAEFVWVSLIVGQALPTFDAARRLGLDGAGQITIDGTPGYGVGAFADNGVPNLADVIVQNGEERILDLGQATTFVIGAESGTTVQSLRSDLKETLPKASYQRLLPGDTVPAQSQGPVGAPQPIGYVEGGVIGSMSFEIMPNGFIRPDPTWVAENIVRAEVPILGVVECHRLMIPRLRGALGDIVEQGLDDKIRPGDYGGCFVPRFIDRDPNKPLSNHAFGLAIDVNVSTNQLGTRGDLDPRIVEIFESYGFTWGGYWSRPDPMHFEL